MRMTIHRPEGDTEMHEFTHEGELVRTYLYSDGKWGISVNRCWVEGIYDSEDDAVAFAFAKADELNSVRNYEGISDG